MEMSNVPYPTQGWGAQPPPYEPSMPPYEGPPQPPYGAPPDAEMHQQFTAGSFSDKSVRRGFIRKVYLILAAQLLATTAVVCVFTFVPAVRLWVIAHRWIYFVSYAVFLVTYIAISCCVNCRRRYPTNIITLAIFTLALSYMTGTLAAYHGTEAVVIAFLMTVALCLALTLFALQTRVDFTMCSGLIFALGMVLLLTGLASLIVYLVIGPSRVMQAVYAGVALVFFSFMLVYDTQQVVGGRRHELEPEEYVFGAMQIYVDIVYIFMMLFTCIGCNSD